MRMFIALFDEYGIIHDATKNLPKDLWHDFLEALSELEDRESHRTCTFPKTRLHKVTGIKEAIYRADIKKTSGWRLHVQFVDGELHLKDIIKGKDHDRVIKVIKSKHEIYD
jgi:hypothetical protein